MAKTRISALAAILAVNLTATDVLPITDLSVPKTNKVTMAQLRTALFAGGTGYSSDPLACGPLTVTGATSVTGTLTATGLVTANAGVSITTAGLAVVAGGLTVSSGATAVQAFQATTGSFSGLVGSSADFQTTTATVAGYNFYNANFRIQVTQATGVMDFKTNNVVGFSLANGGVGASVPGTLAVGGNTTLSGGLTVNNASTSIVLINTTSGAVTDSQQLIFDRGGVAKWRIGNNITATNADLFEIYDEGVGTAVAITKSNLTATFNGTITASAGVLIAGGVSAAGAIYKSPTSGFVLTGITGSSSDLVLAGPGGANVMTVPTGTVNTTFAGTGGFQTIVTVNRGSAAGLLGYYGVFRVGTPLYYLGQDASDRGAILSASAGAANLWWDDSGNFATRGSLTTGGSAGLTVGTGGVVNAGALDVTGNVTVNTNKFTVTASSGNTAIAGTLVVNGGTLNFSNFVGSQKVIGGTVGISFRNNGDTLDNAFLSDAGVMTVRAGLVATAGGVTVTAGGITVNGGTTAIQALTATSALFTGAITTNQTTFTFIGGATDTQFKNAANNATNLTIADAGNVTARAQLIATTHVTAGASSAHSWSGRSQIFSTADSEVQLLNAAGTAFSMLKFGPNTSGGLALKSNLGSLTLQVRRADDLADASLTASTVTAATAFLVNGTQVVGARSTGWTAQVETQAKGSFGGTGAYTLTMLGQWASAIQAALTAHGLLGA